MPTTFVTAAQAEKQVTSHQARLSHAHTFGEGRYLLDGLELTMETPNRLKAGAGVMLIDGSYVTVDEAGQEWVIENGTQAMKRIDLAGYEYSVGEDGMESLAPKVLKGTPHATAPTMPTYAKGSLLDRPAKLFVPVAKVELNGISAKPPTCVLDELPTVAELRDSVSLFEGKARFSSEHSIGIDPEKYRRIEITIERDGVSASHFIDSPRNGVNYAVPLISSPDDSSVRRIAFLEVSFFAGKVNFSKFSYSDNLGSVQTADVEADVRVIGYPRW